MQLGVVGQVRSHDVHDASTHLGQAAGHSWSGDDPAQVKDLLASQWSFGRSLLAVWPPARRLGLVWDCTNGIQLNMGIGSAVLTLLVLFSDVAYRPCLLVLIGCKHLHPLRIDLGHLFHVWFPRFFWCADLLVQWRTKAGDRVIGIQIAMPVEEAIVLGLVDVRTRISVQCAQRTKFVPTREQSIILGNTTLCIGDLAGARTWQISVVAVGIKSPEVQRHED